MRQENQPTGSRPDDLECHCECCRMRRLAAVAGEHALEPAEPETSAAARRGVRVKKTGQTLLLLKVGTDGSELQVDPSSIRWVQEMSVEDVRRGLEEAPEQRRGRIDRLFVKIAAACLAVILPVAAYALSYPVRGGDSAVVVRLDYRPELEAEAQQALAGFLAAPTWQEKQRYVIQSGRVADAMQTWYGDGRTDADLSPAQFYIPEGISTPENDARGITMLARPETGRITGWLRSSVPMLYFFQHGKLDWETFQQSRRGGVLAALQRVAAGEPVTVRAFLVRKSEKLPLDALELCELSSDYVPVARMAVRDEDLRDGPLTAQILPGQPRAAVVEAVKSADGSVTLNRLIHWELMPAPHEPALTAERKTPPERASGNGG